jgi:hypothetical protein
MAAKAVEAFAHEISGALGQRLVALLLYGSAARGTANTKHSDVNTLLVVDVVDDQLFTLLEAPLRSWTDAQHPPPLIMTEPEWRYSADAFPVEYEDIREAHRLLAGRDLWIDVQVEPDHVRRQLERELMGKLVHLRQLYAAARLRPGALASVIEESASGFFTMLRAVLRLAGKTPPAEPGELLAVAGALVGFAAAPLSALASPARPLKLSAGDPLPGAYLAAVTRTTEYVNRFSERTGP